MESYLKIDPIRLGKFNNAEYINFMNRTLNQALAVGVEKIGASETLIDGFTANMNKMTDIVAQSRASVENQETWFPISHSSTKQTRNFIK